LIDIQALAQVLLDAQTAATSGRAAAQPEIASDRQIHSKSIALQFDNGAPIAGRIDRQVGIIIEIGIPAHDIVIVTFAALPS